MPPVTLAKELYSVHERVVDSSVRALPMIRKGSLALLAQALISGSNFLLTILLARWLAPGSYGAYTLAYSIFLFAASFHNALLLEPMGVLGPASHGKRLSAYVGQLIRLHFAIALFLALLVAVGAGVIPHLSSVTGLSTALWGACLGIPWILFFWFLRQAAYLDLRPAVAVRGAVTYALVIVLMLSVLRFAGWLTAFSAFLTQALAAIVAGIFLLTWIRPQLKSAPDSIPMLSIWSQHWKYGRWVVMTAFVYWFSGQAFYFIAAALMKIEDVGTLSALQNFVAPLSQFVTALSLLFLPWASARFASQDGQSFQRAINRISLVFVGAGAAYWVCIAAFGRWLTVILYHGKYVQSAGLIPVLAFSVVLIAASQGPAIGLRAMQAPSKILAGYSVAAAFSILAGFALTRYWGLAGNVLGMAVSSLCFFITVTYCYRSKLRRLEVRDRAERAHFDTTTARVAWLIPSLARANYMQPLFREFTKLFSNTIVFTGLWHGFVPGCEGTFRLRWLAGYRFVTLKKAGKGYGRGFFWAPLSAIRELLTFRPNIIFTSAFSIWTLYALTLKAFTRSRVIIFWEGTSATVAYLDSPVRLRIRKVMARLADASVSNMRMGVEYLRDVLGVPDSKLLHHPYEVADPSVLCSGANEVRLGGIEHPTFLFVGSIIPRKGWSCLIEAASRLVERGLDRFSLVFVGAGDQGADLQAQISLRGLEGFVHQVGQVSYQNLGAYYQASDVFVFPTREDTWGLVLLEAMAFGKPVLCSKYAGSKEMVRHGLNGFIFDPDSPEELASYMAHFIQNPHLVLEFGACSSETIAPYTPARAANVLAGLVVKLMDSEGRGLSSMPYWFWRRCWSHWSR
ncbi:MAG: glycosyltransferase [Candidatus Acidiferrales bacterium]